MPLRRHVQLVGLLFVPLLGGCLPATWPEMPSFKGRVVNAAGQPVCGAKVKVLPEDASKGGHVVELTTDRLGRFYRGEEVRLAFAVFLPLDILEPLLIATARLNDFESKPIEFAGRIVNPHYLGIANLQPTIELGDLVVRESPAPTRNAATFSKQARMPVTSRVTTDEH